MPAPPGPPPPSSAADALADGTRIGLLNPSAGVTIEHEWPRMLPAGVSMHVTRMALRNGTPEELARMEEAAVGAAGLLADARISVLCFGCTIGCVHRGPAGEDELVGRLALAAGRPVVTMARSAVAALAALGARRIAVANPYGAEVNGLLCRYLEAAGLEIAALHARPTVESWAITRIPPEDVAAIGRRAAAAAGRCDALFLSCGNLRTIEVIEPLERELGVPVVSSNQAMLWNALRASGRQHGISGFGLRGFMLPG
jgi:maleate isomerase